MADVSLSPEESLLAGLGPVGNKAQLLEQLRGMLTAKALRTGDRLPNERQIAQVTGLSRSTVRDVLGLLEREGRIVRHVGRGTYVSEVRSPAPASPPLSDVAASPAELMEFRQVLEPSLVSLIVLSASDEELTSLEEFVLSGRRVEDWKGAEYADSGFHQRLFDATGNRLFSDTGRRLVSIRQQPAWLRVKERSFTPAKWNVYQGEHEAIVSALLDRDAELAADLLRAHLAGVRARVRPISG